MRTYAQKFSALKKFVDLPRRCVCPRIYNLGALVLYFLFYIRRKRREYDGVGVRMQRLADDDI